MEADFKGAFNNVGDNPHNLDSDMGMKLDLLYWTVLLLICALIMGCATRGKAVFNDDGTVTAEINRKGVFEATLEGTGSVKLDTKSPPLISLPPIKYEQ